MQFLKLTRTIEINGRTIECDVTINVHEDHDIPVEDTFDFGDAKANAEYLARFRGSNAKLFSANILVEATALGEHGFDSLCACHVHCNNFFDSKPFETDVNDFIKEHDMVQIALDDLKTTIVNKANQMSQFATSEA